MSQDGMSRLEEIVRAVVTGPEGGSDSTMTVLAAELRTKVKQQRSDFVTPASPEIPCGGR